MCEPKLSMHLKEMRIKEVDPLWNAQKLKDGWCCQVSNRGRLDRNSEGSRSDHCATTSAAHACPNMPDQVLIISYFEMKDPAINRIWFHLFFPTTLEMGIDKALAKI